MFQISKMVISRLLLGSYLLALFEPLQPYWEYVFNKSYISQRFCENRDRPELKCEGKCYLNKQLRKAAASSATETKPASVKRHFDEDSVYLNQLVEGDNDFQCAASRLRLEAGPSFSSELISEIFHPPRHTFALHKIYYSAITG